MADTLPMDETGKRRFSFQVSEDSRNVHSRANSTEGNTSVMVDVDIRVRNDKDFE